MESALRAERRASPRRCLGSERPIRAQVRAGRELMLRDISMHGALLEGPHRLLPGVTLDLQFVAEHGHVAVRARVVRSAVSSVWATMVWYRGAVAFVEPLEQPWTPAEPGEWVGREGMNEKKREEKREGKSEENDEYRLLLAETAATGARRANPSPIDR